METRDLLKQQLITAHSQLIEELEMKYAIHNLQLMQQKKSILLHIQQQFYQRMQYIDTIYDTANLDTSLNRKSLILSLFNHNNQCNNTNNCVIKTEDTNTNNQLTNGAGNNEKNDNTNNCKNQTNYMKISVDSFGELNKKIKQKISDKTNTNNSMVKNSKKKPSNIKKLKFRLTIKNKKRNKINKPNKPNKPNKTKIDKKPFVCERCAKKFKLRHNLKNHLATHATKRPYKCSHCRRGFKTVILLKSHINNVHSTEKPFKCTKCNKRCKTKSNLNVHARIHTGEKPHKCDKCNKRFNTTSNLKCHVKIHHS